jgi:hypothetical protein
MDSLITAAARSLASGDALGALNYIALRDDPPALALRGIAMAQLGDLNRAKTLLRRAARASGPREVVARARCTVAEAEVALVSRDLNWPVKALDTAHDALERYGDLANAAHARYLAIRRLLLIGHLDQAERLIEDFDPAPLPIASRAAYELAVAGIAIRRLRTGIAHAALARAERAARQARIASLAAEVESAARVLDTPAARLIARGEVRILRLDDIEALLGSKALVVDACRRVVCHAGTVISLETRPILFALARALAEAWPGDVSRAALLARAFRAKHADESHRARLRVEVGRLRKALACGRRSLVEFSVGAGARRKSAHRAARARRSYGGWQGARDRPRPGTPLDDAAGAGFPDNLVTPGRAASWLGCPHETNSSDNRPRIRPLSERHACAWCQL